MAEPAHAERWRSLWLLLPLWIVGTIGWGMLVAGVERPVAGVVVRGGPLSSDTHPLSLSLQAQAVTMEQRLPLQGRVIETELRSSQGRLTQASCTTNPRGLCDLLLPRPPAGEPPDTMLVVHDEEKTLAELALSEAPRRWPVQTERSTGWLAGTASGALRLRIGLATGLLAVPFASSLVIARAPATDRGAAREQTAAAGNWALSMELQGATRSAPDQSLELGSEAPLSVPIVPEDHAISLRIVARSENGSQGQWFGALPVARGAMTVSWQGQQLLVRSPIARELAYVSLVTETERRAAEEVALEMQADGTAQGTWQAPDWLSAAHAAEESAANRAPIWGVVSSEYDRLSAGTVGWQLVPRVTPAQVATTFQANDLLWVDTRKHALHQETLRAARERRSFVLLALCGALVLVLLMAWRLTGRRGAPSIAGASADTLSSATPARIGLLLCVVASILALAWLGWHGTAR